MLNVSLSARECKEEFEDLSKNLWDASVDAMFSNDSTENLKLAAQNVQRLKEGLAEGATSLSPISEFLIDVNLAISRNSPSGLRYVSSRCHDIANIIQWFLNVYGDSKFGW